MALIVAFTLPFALVGGAAGVALSSGGRSARWSGSSRCWGSRARNGIMLVSHYRHREDSESVPFGPGLVRQGSEERLAPILMTAVVILGGLSPRRC